MAHMHTLTYTQKFCSWLSQRLRLEVWLLLYRSCVKVYQVHVLRAGVVLVADTATERKKMRRVTVYRLPIRLPAKSALTWPVV